MFWFQPLYLVPVG